MVKPRLGALTALAAALADGFPEVAVRVVRSLEENRTDGADGSAYFAAAREVREQLGMRSLLSRTVTQEEASVDG